MSVRTWAFGSGGSIWNAEPDRGRRPRKLGESYLALAAIDLDDNDRIREFVLEWGILGVRWRQDPRTWERVEDEEYRHLFGQYADGYARIEPAHLEDGSLHTEDEDAADLVPAIVDGLRESVGEAQLMDHDLFGVVVATLTDGSEEVGSIDETIDEFRFGASLIRDLLRAWRWLSEGDEPDAWECDLNIRKPPASMEDAAEWFRDWASPLLTPFYPKFDITEEFEVDRVGVMPTYYNNVSLLNVMAVELYNHICENAHYKRCASETCGRLFVRQHGRAIHRQHRTTGVKYCSAGCARAQAQRAYRRRQDT